MPSTSLTKRQIEVLKHVSRGGNIPEFADEYMLSIKTVECHIASLRASLGISAIADLTHYAIRRGYTKLKDYDELGVSHEHRHSPSNVVDNKGEKSLDK